MSGESKHDHAHCDRRAFLGSAAATPLLTPGMWHWVPEAAGKTLVVFELDGGNDGLNTILPSDRSTWAKARPQLSSVRRGAHELDDGFALHPSLREVHRLMRDGSCAAVHGVGYANSSKSHFKSRDIWHTADLKFADLKADTTGWLGRTADVLAAGALKDGAAVPALSVGSLDVPLILKAKDVVVPSVQRIEDYQLAVGGGGDRDGRRQALVETVKSEAARGDDLRSFLGGVAKTAVDNAEKLRRSLQRYRAKAKYPQSSLGNRLRLLSRIIVSGFGTRLFHVNFGGFDTHASQLNTHAALLRQFSQAMHALVMDLKAHGKLDDVLVMVQSEFGRRVGQNRSRGTDHGRAGPMFFFGSKVKPGLHGEHPSLTDLQQGDLKPTADFRELYAAALGFVGVAPKKVLGRDFEGVNPLA